MGVCGEVGVCGSTGVPSKLELSGGHLGAEWNRQVSGASVSTAGKGVRIGSGTVLKLCLSGRSSGDRSHQRSEENKGKKDCFSHENHRVSLNGPSAHRSQSISTSPRTVTSKKWMRHR